MTYRKIRQCGYVQICLSVPSSSKLCMKSYFISLDVCFPIEHRTNCPKSTMPVRRILAHICQIKWNLISFGDENDEKTLSKRSYTEKNI